MLGWGPWKSVSGNVFFPHKQFSASHPPSVLHHLASQQLGNKRIREKLPLQYICSGCLSRAQDPPLPETKKMISTQLMRSTLFTPFIKQTMGNTGVIARPTRNLHPQKYTYFCRFSNPSFNLFIYLYNAICKEIVSV